MTRRITSWCEGTVCKFLLSSCKLAFLCELGRWPTHLLGLKTEEGARKKVSLNVTSMVALEGTLPICWQPFARIGRDWGVWGGQSKVNPIPRGHSNQIPSRANTSHGEGRVSTGPWLGAQLQLTLPPAMVPSWKQTLPDSIVYVGVHTLLSLFKPGPVALASEGSLLALA